MKFLCNQFIPRSLWKEFIDSNLFTSPFQSYEFFRFFNSIPGYHADAFAVEEFGCLIALSVVTVQKEPGIKSFFSRRGIIYGGPLICPDHPAALPELIKQVQLFYDKKLIYIEIRNYFNYSTFKSIFARQGWEYQPWLNFHLNTTDKAEMESSMSSNRLRQIHKAIKNGAVWKEADKLEDIQSFYQILDSLYKEKVKKPLMRWDFFKQFFEQSIGKYLLVYFQGKVIGGIMCFIFPAKAIYEFYICGLDHDYKNQYPSIMATWAAMEYAYLNGIPLFDFMGAGSPEEQYGVRDFKARFGGKFDEHGRFLKILNPFLYEIGKLGLKLLSKFQK